MATRVNPTFLLKGIDPSAIMRDYLQGVFSHKPINREKIHITATTTILAPTYGTTNFSPIFIVKDRNNSSVIVATTGHDDFEIFNKTGQIPENGGRCMHCVRDFTGPRTGYPVATQENTILVNDQYRVMYTFWVEGSFCSYECALGYLQQHLNQRADYRDSTIRDSEQMLYQLYSLVHPKEGRLRPAQDPLLLKTNGGSLTVEEWCDRRHQYKRTDRLLIIPAKVEYIQQHFPGHTIDIL